MAGNATAEFTAVCCCVPCAVMDIVVLAAYKVPAGLVKKAMRGRKRSLQQKKMKKKKKEEALLEPQNNEVVGSDAVNVVPTLEEQLAKETAETAKLEAEMWAQFNGGGFWRSCSQRQNNEPEHQTGEANRDVIAICNSVK